MGDRAAGSCIDGSTKNNCNAVTQHRTEKAQHKTICLFLSLILIKHMQKQPKSHDMQKHKYID